MILSSFFFFSSRRRHTRFSRDWSSDVCSSDLVERCEPVYEEMPGWSESTVGVREWSALPRSEERRVGKECRYGSYSKHFIRIQYGRFTQLAKCLESSFSLA